MASVENVTAARLISCTLEPVGLINSLVRTITIKESVCSPHLTGEILLLDNDNIINVNAIKGGALCHINFDGADPGSGPAYSVDMYVLHIVAVSSPENYNLKIYTISMVSSEYFTDRGQTVSINSSQGATGVQLIQQIWTECGFQVPLIPVGMDMIMQDGNQPLHIEMAKPFTAIGQIREMQLYPDFAGNVMFFHNRDGSVHQEILGPLSMVYNEAISTEVFIQRETWGIDWKHLFGGDQSFHSIISLNQQSRDVMLDPEAFAPDKQILVATDQNAGKMATNLVNMGVAQGAGQNVPHTNSDRVEPPHDPYNKITRERWYAHCMKATPPKYLVRVPLKTGLNITAGGACTLDMQPVHPNYNAKNPHSGNYWITDLIHEVHNDLREVNGTTTFNALMKGYCI